MTQTPHMARINIALSEQEMAVMLLHWSSRQYEDQHWLTTNKLTTKDITRRPWDIRAANPLETISGPHLLSYHRLLAIFSQPKFSLFP